MQGRIITTAIVLFIAFFLLGSKVSYIQVYKGDALKTKFNAQFIYKEKIESARGKICDRNGKTLAMHMQARSYYCMPQEVGSIHKAAQTAAHWFGLDDEKLKNMIKKRKSFFWIKRKVLDDEAQTGDKLPKGIGYIVEGKRLYPYDDFACHVLGTTGMDNHGMSGIEYFFNDVLKGKTHVLQVGKDRAGRNIVSREVLNKKNTAQAVYLTIDEKIQYFTERAADKLYEKHEAKAVTIVVQSVKTGEILGLVNRPSFDPNHLTKNDVQFLRNDVVSKIYEPGSTLKVFIGGAALEEGIIQPDTPIFCENGKYKVFGHFINDHEKRGTLSFNDVIVYSSNIGMAKIGEMLGKERMYKYLFSFGFGNYSGLSLPGDAKGILHHPRKWSNLSPYIVAFGQEIGVTPIQLVSAYSALANNGVLLQPQIVYKTIDAEGKKVTSFKKQTVRRVVSKKTSELIIRAMEDVVKRGTAKLVNIPGYRIAGKTGTAQKRDSETGKYSDTNYIASFCGFFPVSDPEFTILVMVDEPKGIYWGGEVCGPAFRDISKAIISYKHILPDEDKGDVL